MAVHAAEARHGLTIWCPEHRLVQPEPIPKPPAALFFMHVPKAGSSFQISLDIHSGNHTGGNHSNSPPKKALLDHAFAHHVPLPVDATLAELASAGALLRHPDDRLLSMYDWLRARPATAAAAAADFGGPNLEAYKRVANLVLRGGSGASVLGACSACQVHMLCGWRCCSQHEYGDGLPAAVRRAKERIDALFFVGLTEQWRDSVCLFNFQQTGVRYVTQQQLHNCRPTPSGLRNRSQQLLSSLPRDEADHAVYEHAAARFHRELRRHWISAESCLMASEEMHGNSCSVDGWNVWAQQVARLKFETLFPWAQRQYT